MNKKVYLSILYSVTIIVILISCLSSFRGCSGGFHGINIIGGLGVSKHVDQDFDISEFNNINCSLVVASVSIEKGDKYSVSFSGTENMLPTVEVKNGTLFIKQSTKNKKNNSNGKIVITVCKDEFGEFALSSNVGDLQLADLSFSKLTAETNVGDVKLKDVTVKGKTSIESNVGDVSLKNCSLSDTEIEVNVGEFRCENTFKKDDVLYKLNTDIGSVKFFGEKKGKNYKSESGSITLDVDVNVGDIKVE